MQRPIVIVGPTGVGKSAVAVELAKRLDAEIVSCDSMQVYRGAEILSQAPTVTQRREVPHHMVACIDPTRTFSVAEYRSLAIPAVEKQRARGKSILIVGGTGLYLKVLTQGLCDAPPGDAKLRYRLQVECSDLGSMRLHNRLQKIDGPAAARIHPNDTRRIIRALEVYTLTGKPISRWWQAQDVARPWGDMMVIGLTRERQELYERINARVLEMIYEQGVINEVRRLLQQPLSQTVRQIHGLADLEGYLERDVSLPETMSVWQQRVRNYARRQWTWFRRTPGLHWIEMLATEPPSLTAERILELVRDARVRPSDMEQ